MTVTIVRQVDLETLRLDRGGHDGPNDGTLGEACLLEVAAWMAGEDWSCSPQCVCPALAAYGRRLNDLLPDDRRQELRQYVIPMLGTAGDGHEDTRRFMALDWSLRVATPMWMDAADQPEAAARLRVLAPIVDWDTRQAGRVVIRDIRDQMWKLRNERLDGLRAKARAVDVAVADAVAVAVADAVAVAVDVDVDVAVAVADAVADAVDVAVADAVADAVDDADGKNYWATYRKAYDAARAVYVAHIEQRFGPITTELHTQAIALLGQMCAVGK